MASKIKICHLTSVHKATDTRIFYKECRSQASEYEVYLVAPAPNDYEKDGVKIIALKKPGNRFSRFVITDTILLFKALRIRAVLYHIHDPELLITGIILRLFGKKVIYDVEEFVSANLYSKKWVPIKPVTRMLYAFVENIAIGLKIPFILAEQSYTENYKNRTTLKYAVIQNFVTLRDVPEATNEYNRNGNIFAFVGTLSARRGLPFIIEAISILKNKGMTARLCCVGEVNDSVLNILNQSEFWPEVKDQVEFLGYVPFPDCVSAIQDCIAGLALPENLPNQYGSYPTKMFEYMAGGLPVISSDFELYKDVVNRFECGISVNPENSSQIADAMEYFMTNPEKAKRFSENARIGVKNFDWKTEEQKLLKFYKDVLN